MRSKLGQPGRSNPGCLQLVCILSAPDPGFLRSEQEPLLWNSDVSGRAAVFSSGIDPARHRRAAATASECPGRGRRPAHPVYDRRLTAARPEGASGLRPGRCGSPIPTASPPSFERPISKMIRPRTRSGPWIASTVTIGPLTIFAPPTMPLIWRWRPAESTLPFRL